MTLPMHIYERLTRDFDEGLVSHEELVIELIEYGYQDDEALEMAWDIEGELTRD